jgi:hypothetical protein
VAFDAHADERKARGCIELWSWEGGEWVEVDVVEYSAKKCDDEL